jgi:capsular exopolysaccharide synthesis family protein
MSRIHEALKKAAEQKSPLTSVLPEAVMLEVTGDEQGQHSTTNVKATPARAELKKEARTAAPARFEDIVSKCAHPLWTWDPRFTVFSGSGQDTLSAERLRTLRSRLIQIGDTQTIKKLLVTSSVAAEGKSFIISNLAQSLAQTEDRRVLLIDADLRAPRLHTALGTNPRPGLAEYLLGEADEYQIIQQGGEKNLCFIPFGREVADPSELLSRERMRKLLDFVGPAFDWILFDSPPVLPVHDASILADLCDGVLFVLRAGATTSVLAEKAVAEFRKKNLLGVVLNGADRRDSYGGYYYDSEYTNKAML